MTTGRAHPTSAMSGRMYANHRVYATLYVLDIRTTRVVCTIAPFVPFLLKKLRPRRQPLLCALENKTAGFGNCHCSAINYHGFGVEYGVQWY